MKIPKLARLLAEDFADQTGWIEKLIGPLNSYSEFVSSALAKGLTLTDNMAADIKTVEVSGTWPVKVAIGFRPLTVLVGNCYRTDGASFTASAAIGIQWQYNQSGQLQIDGVFGITPSVSDKYKLVLECKAG